MSKNLSFLLASTLMAVTMTMALLPVVVFLLSLFEPDCQDRLILPDSFQTSCDHPQAQSVFEHDLGLPLFSARSMRRMSLPFPEPWPIYRWPDGSWVSVYIDRCLIFLFESHDWTAEIGVDANREILQWIHQPMAMMDGKWVPGPSIQMKRSWSASSSIWMFPVQEGWNLFDSSLIHGNDRG